jgi:hypothetical protein
MRREDRYEVGFHWRERDKRSVHIGQAPRILIEHITAES